MSKFGTIEKNGNFLVLSGPDNKRITHEEIPMSGKTLQIEVKLANIARELGLTIRKKTS